MNDDIIMLTGVESFFGMVVAYNPLDAGKGAKVTSERDISSATLMTSGEGIFLESKAYVQLSFDFIAGSTFKDPVKLIYERSDAFPDEVARPIYERPDTFPDEDMAREIFPIELDRLDIMIPKALLPRLHQRIFVEDCLGCDLAGGALRFELFTDVSELSARFISSSDRRLLAFGPMLEANGGSLDMDEACREKILEDCLR